MGKAYGYEVFRVEQGTHLVRERLADGRQAEGAVSPVQSIRGLRGVSAESHKQKWENSVAGGVRDFSHKSRCRGGETGPTDLGSPFFPGGPELWHHPLAYSTAGELPGTLQHATLVHPALHPQVPAPMSLPHPTTLTSIHASLPHFLPSPALASPVGSPSSQPNIAVSNAPCSTLFVANLGQFVSEHELKDIFSSFPGFSRLRMHTKGGSPVAFVEYQDVRYAAQAMATLQGSFLLSSDRGAIRIEYAKSKMAEVGFTNLWIEGSKREENGQP
ncbi:uncharacterized protein LOC117605079 isoform X4 [Osmia lignaria lignaria]|uniref:uncharacterized protein LOC117605079 isoform X4 n=1 Tax=Osmia lignaria lignaria TaxID=1437193 RepID=UPI00402BF25B